MRSPNELPSEGSRDYGRPFAEIFTRFGGDFYPIDPLLFSPAEVLVTAIDSGRDLPQGTRGREPARCLVRVSEGAHR